MVDSSRVTKYEPRCILAQEDCTTVEKHAVAYDFVHAAFINPEKKGFDGKLTPEEKEAVIQKFGEIASDVKGYLSRVNGMFFRGHSSALGCAREDVEYQPTKSKSLGRGEFVGGSHGCGKFYSDPLISSGVLVEMIGNPNEWIIMLEGAEAGGSVDEHFPEVAFFKSVAKALGTKIEDPIITLWDKRTLDKLPQKLGIKFEDFVAAHAFHSVMMLNVQYGVRPFARAVDMGMKLIDTEFKEYGISLDLDGVRKRLEADMIIPDGADIDTVYQARYDKAMELFDRVADLSNELCRERTLSLLKGNTPANAIFIIGSGHLAISDIYK